MAVNGQVFYDGAGAFTAVRQYLLTSCPEDLRRKRIAARCMMLAQTGQYNLSRSLRRGHTVTAFTTAARFVDETVAMTFLLNGAYKPYYKWQFPAMERLPEVAPEVGALLRKFVETGDWDRKNQLAEEICAVFVRELRARGLSDAGDDFLAAHGQAVQNTITDSLLRQLPPQVS